MINESDLKLSLHEVVSYALLRIDFLSDGKYEDVYFKNIRNGWEHLLMIGFWHCLKIGVGLMCFY